MSGHVTLVLGGARSGKSTWAEQHARDSGRQVLYVATATAGDDEMAERIAAHQAQRPTSWRTIEEPLRLREAIEVNAEPGVAVLVDCLTLWVSNVLLQQIGPDADGDTTPSGTWRSLEAAMAGEIDRVLALAHDRDLDLILVSNEVGMGMVPTTSLGRRYRDVLGRVNQIVASYAETTILMIAGLPIDLRRLVAAR